MKLLEYKDRFPVWFMRQAGRYHTHYQHLRSLHDFETLCKNSKLATTVTMGPVEEFDFDAAILFSDLLFPLEYLGLGLTYRNGPPQLALKLDSVKKIQHLTVIGELEPFFEFQRQALLLIKDQLTLHNPDVSLLGFVGPLWTLFAYAVEGSHAGGLVSSKLGLIDGRYELFCEKMSPILIKNIQMQIDGKADCICLFDTAAGELDAKLYKKYIWPGMEKILKTIKLNNPSIKILYYTKHTHLEHLECFNPEYIDIIGIDWRMDLSNVLSRFGKDFYIQGNMDPSLLFWPWNDLKEKIISDYQIIKNNTNIDKWIFSLGHGVLPNTPQENVKKVVQLAKTLKQLIK